jgi:hypothetical protein
MAEGKTAGGVICESLVGPARSEILDHIVTSPGIGRSAWFKDPDGNTITVFQPSAVRQLSTDR